MPCDTIRTTTVELGSSTNTELLLAALNELGLSAYRQSATIIRFGRGEFFDATTGRLEVATSRDVNEIKRAYSNQVVLAQAKKFGWQLKKVAQNKYAVQRR